MATLYILSGLPFSGKSTFAKKAEEETSVKRISFDDLWASFVAIDENIAYDTMISEIKKLIGKQLEKGYSVLYDSTNLKEEHRKEMINIAKESNAELVTIYFSISIEQMRKRQETSLIDKSHHVISEDVIQVELELNSVPYNALIVETEEDKEKLLQEIKKLSPKE